MLPRLVQWYIRPAGDNTTFTSFPWIGFVFAGAAVGALLTSVWEKPSERRLLTAIGAAGVLLIAGGFYAASRPSIYADSYFWTTSPAYFCVRLPSGPLTTMAALFWAGEIVEVVAAPVPTLRMLAHFGRSSLFSTGSMSSW